MLSTALELAGFAAITYGVYLLAGAGCAFLTGGLSLLVVAAAADGVHPVRAMRARRWFSRLRLHFAKLKA